MEKALSDASELFRQCEFNQALQAYTRSYQYLPAAGNVETKVNILFNKSACYLKLKQFNKVVEECNGILDLNPNNGKALGRKIKALCSLGKFADAQALADSWIQREPKNAQALKEKERIEIIIKALNEQDGDDSIEETSSDMPVSMERVPPEGREADKTQSPSIPASVISKSVPGPSVLAPVLSKSMAGPSISASVMSKSTSGPSVPAPVMSTSLSGPSVPIPVISKFNPASGLTPGCAPRNVGQITNPPDQRNGHPSAQPHVSPSPQSDLSLVDPAKSLADSVLQSATNGLTQAPAVTPSAIDNRSNAHEPAESAITGRAAVDPPGLTQGPSECHQATEVHADKLVVGPHWKHRPPPRGLTSREYSKCPRYFDQGTCRFGDNCSLAHSDAELKEWTERFELRKQQLQAARQAEGDSFSYAQALVEKWMSAEKPETVMTENMEGVNVHASSDLSLTMSSTKSSHSWTFTVTSKQALCKVALLEDDSRKYFTLATVTVGPKRSQKAQTLPEKCQEWANTEYTEAKSNHENVYRIKVLFHADIYGTFRQTVVLDFHCQPVIARQLCVDSTPICDLDKLTQDLVLREGGKWDLSATQLVPFEPKMKSLNDEELCLLQRFGPPVASRMTMSPTLMDPCLTRDNYRSRMHALLTLEEMAQFSSVAKYNVTVQLKLVSRFMLMPSAQSTAKFAQGGELFAHIKLNTVVSEDTSEGRLILQNVNTVYLAPAGGEGEDQPDSVYEAMVEEKGKNFIYLRLSKKCVSELQLTADTELNAEVQFQLNRLPLCEMHFAVDRLTCLNAVFPSLDPSVNIPWTPGKQWPDHLNSRLNPKQKEAVVALTTPPGVPLGPILLVGPYGTGKTFTLAQATMEILRADNTRVLICTHSNSAADLYIKDYFHPAVVEGREEVTPIRLLYRHRWVQTVHPTVLKYCLASCEAGCTVFRAPTRDDLQGVRVVVATLSTSRLMLNLDLEPGFFTHILLDEAAQAMECEALLPLCLAADDTRIVLAGDHMQMSPEVHSDFARDRGFQLSLLERLYDLYPEDHSRKILLCENYRSNKTIIDYTSELFYDNRLVASGNQPRHEKFYPLTFFTARGEEVQHQNSTNFYNTAEVYELVERVAELLKCWPSTWETNPDSQIGVLCPYSDQVFRLRAEFRKRKMNNVSVERVLNVQGKQFRAVFLSTVRTQHTCSAAAIEDDVMDYGFLSNVKLLNTAITRAQSLVAVVGDPVSLCSVGKCRKLWERFIELSHENGGLFGTTWRHLRAQLDGVELKKTYVLNPLAPEFVPNRLRHACYEPPEPISKGKYGYTFTTQPSQTGAPLQYGRPRPRYRPPFWPPASLGPPRPQSTSPATDKLGGPIFASAWNQPFLPTAMVRGRMPSHAVTSAPTPSTSQPITATSGGALQMSSAAAENGGKTTPIAADAKQGKKAEGGVPGSSSITSRPWDSVIESADSSAVSPQPRAVTPTQGASIGQVHPKVNPYQGAPLSHSMHGGPGQGSRMVGYTMPMMYTPMPPLGVGLPAGYPVAPAFTPGVYANSAQGVRMPVMTYCNYGNTMLPQGPENGLYSGLGVPQPGVGLASSRQQNIAKSGTGAVSPTSCHDDSALAETSSAQRPSQSIKFLSTACNTQAGESNSQPALSNQSGVASAPAPTNERLQRELYSYVRQTEGEAAAKRFLLQYQSLRQPAAHVKAGEPHAGRHPPPRHVAVHPQGSSIVDASSGVPQGALSPGALYDSAIVAAKVQQPRGPYPQSLATAYHAATAGVAPPGAGSALPAGGPDTAGREGHNDVRWPDAVLGGGASGPLPLRSGSGTLALGGAANSHMAGVSTAQGYGQITQRQLLTSLQHQYRQQQVQHQQYLQRQQQQRQPSFSGQVGFVNQSSSPHCLNSTSPAVMATSSGGQPHTGHSLGGAWNVKAPSLPCSQPPVSLWQGASPSNGVTSPNSQLTGGGWNAGVPSAPSTQSHPGHAWNASVTSPPPSQSVGGVWSAAQKGHGAATAATEGAGRGWTDGGRPRAFGDGVEVVVPGARSAAEATSQTLPLYMRGQPQYVATAPTPKPSLSYAGALRQQPVRSQAPVTMATTTTTQSTPCDETGVHDDLHPNPLDLLKNLNIKASPGTQNLFDYFS